MENIYNQLNSELSDISYEFNPQIRDNFVYEISKELPNNSKVIDISSGSKPYQKLFSHCLYTSHEFSGNLSILDTFRNENNSKNHDIYSPITAIPVDSNSYDLVICTEVFEHIPEPIEAMKELVRLCKIGGKILLTAPFTSGIHQEPYHYYSGFSPYFYKYLAEKFNLKIEKFWSQGDMFLLNVNELERCREIKLPILRNNNNYNWLIDTSINLLKKYFFHMSDYLKLSKNNNPENMFNVDYGNRFSIGYCLLFEKL